MKAPMFACLLCGLFRLGTFEPANTTALDELDILEELDDELATSDRRGRFFPLFTIIRFSNTECAGAGSFTGTCFTRRECTDLGGLHTAKCASKRGVCCVVQKTCGASSNVNNTYFINSGYPGSFNGGSTCSIYVTRCNSDICQLRIDFLDFSLAQPTGDGVCATDFFTVSGGSSRVPRICGENAGQHVYVNFNGNNPIVITVTTSAALSFNRRWNLKLTQLACNCPTLAPSGCLMYYTGATGTVRSFNYGVLPNQALTAQNLVGTREIVNLNYGVCVRMEAGYCSIGWAQTSDIFSFTLTSDVRGLGVAVGTAAGVITGAACTSDYVVIPHPVSAAGASLAFDRFCGVGFAPVTTASKPFVLTVVTDGNEAVTPDDSNRGFILDYTQQVCLPV